MARVVKLDELLIGGPQSEVQRASITNGQTKWMSADLVRVDPDVTLDETVPPGSDCYIFVLRGSAQLRTEGRQSLPLPLQATAVVQDGQAWQLSAADQGCDAIIVHAPPPGSSVDLPGFAGGVRVCERSSLPIVDVPEQKKKRHYIVGKEAAPSERGHAMIVDYVSETITPMHHHPNADSMFVLLDGSIRFSADGQDVVVEPGGAAVFAAGDKHSVRCAEGISQASFLEFHVPAAFTTIKE